MTCPRCTAELVEQEGRFPSCESCGYTQLDSYSLELMREIKREFEKARQEYYPDPVPSYREYMNPVKIR